MRDDDNPSPPAPGAALTRRGWLQATVAAGTLPLAAATRAGEAAPPSACPGAEPRFGRGVENQRQADLGDGSFRNPIVPGDHPDPTILKDGADYYMTFSSFQSYPGAVIWHSKDLVGWAPIGAALHTPIGSVWAMDLVKHQGRYYLYIPSLREGGTAIHVIHAADIRGPWSEPIDLKLPGCIDPGHAVGEDGRRYLFVNGVRRIRLADDGLSTEGELEPACTPWRYPDDWVVEMFAPEGPKVFRRGDWFYLVAAVGGTAGPPTSHMVTLARSASIHGPWEQCPHNPVVHTRCESEPWWSRGHASVVEGPAGDWWMVYHGYENGYRTLGRQTLLEPLEWTRDGWFRARGGTLAEPLAKPPGGLPGPAGQALSDDFAGATPGPQWSFFAPGPQEAQRLRQDGRGLLLQGKGGSPADCSPLTCLVGDRHYEATLEFDIEGDAAGGLALYYDPRGFAGVGFNGSQMLTWHYGQEHTWMREGVAARSLHLKVTSRSQVASFQYSSDGRQWLRHPWQMEVSGLHHNVFGGFLSLKIALLSIGHGAVRLRRFSYRGLAA